MDKRISAKELLKIINKKIRTCIVDDGTEEPSVGIFLDSEPLAFIYIPNDDPTKVTISDAHGNFIKIPIEDFIKD